MGTNHLVIGAPVYNEEDGILTFLNRIDDAAGEISAAFTEVVVDLLLVNDGSTDRTLEVIRAFKPRHLEKVIVCQFSKNFGHTAAVCGLINEAKGDALILMDADLQDEPGVLVELVRKWKKGALSIRVRRGRRKEGQFFSFLSKSFYWLYGKLSGLESQLGIFGLYDQRVFHALRQMPEVVRYHPGLLSIVGFKTEFVEVDRAKRQHGESRVGFLKLLKLANQAIFSFSTVPVLLVTMIGLLISVAAFIGGCVVVYIRIFTNLAISGWASLLAGQLFLTGLVIFSLGIIGQYIAIIAEEVKRRPKYFMESIFEIAANE
jgi:glycosyltransferase involved in cell wall biosynthesis